MCHGSPEQVGKGKAFPIAAPPHTQNLPFFRFTRRHPFIQFFAIAVRPFLLCIFGVGSEVVASDAQLDAVGCVRNDERHVNPFLRCHSFSWK